ncbi:MAG: hypothetical protein AAGU11_14260 [Syntrophobacteraceae bacterium]
MGVRRAWAFQSFVICVLLNSVLAGLIFMMAQKIMAGIMEWTSPFLKPGASNLPHDLTSAFGSLNIFLSQLQQYLAPGLAALTLSVTLLLWFFVYLLGLRQIRRAAAAVATTDADRSRSESGELDSP